MHRGEEIGYNTEFLFGYKTQFNSKTSDPVKLFVCTKVTKQTNEFKSLHLCGKGEIPDFISPVEVKPGVPHFFVWGEGDDGDSENRHENSQIYDLALFQTREGALAFSQHLEERKNLLYRIDFSREKEVESLFDEHLKKKLNLEGVEISFPKTFPWEHYFCNLNTLHIKEVTLSLAPKGLSEQSNGFISFD